MAKAKKTKSQFDLSIQLTTWFEVILNGHSIEPIDLLFLDLRGNDPEEIISEEKIQIEFSYPLRKPVLFKMDDVPITLADFISFVVTTYEKIYREEEETSKIKEGPYNATIWNRNWTNGKYGIGLHTLNELALEGAELDKDGIWKLHIGS